MAGKRWKEEEIKRLKELIYLDMSYKSIGDILDRTPNSCAIQASRLKITTPSNPWTTEDLDILKIEVERGTTYLRIASLLSRNEKAVGRMGRQLGYSSKNKVQLSPSEYRKLLPKGLEPLEDYTNANTKIMHKHSCGHIWNAHPAHILYNKFGCPNCSKTGFDAGKPGYTYLIEFPSLGLFKVGITGNLAKRLNEFGYSADLIFYRYFEEGRQAQELETKWLRSLKPLLHNSKELNTGNTETFLYEDYSQVP